MKRQRHASPRTSSRSTLANADLSTEPAEPQASTPNSPVHERIPPQWSWHYRLLRQLRVRLLRAYAEQSTQAMPAEMLVGGAAATAHEQIEGDVLWAELAREPERLFEVDCALQRIRDGTYGFCEETGHPIPAERLREAPWTRYAPTTTQPIAQRPADAKDDRR